MEAPTLPEHPPCPHCDSEDTELLSMFGTVLANAQFYCRGCRSAFEHMKWSAPGARDDG